MSERVTRAHVDAAAARYRRAVDALGMLAPGATIVIDAGSPTYSRAWRIACIAEGHTGHGVAPGFDAGGYLGWSAREAHVALSTVARALEDVEHYQRTGAKWGQPWL